MHKNRLKLAEWSLSIYRLKCLHPIYKAFLSFAFIYILKIFQTFIKKFLFKFYIFYNGLILQKLIIDRVIDMEIGNVFF